MFIAMTGSINVNIAAIAVRFTTTLLFGRFACLKTWNLSVLSSIKIVSLINVHNKIFFVLYHQVITVYRCLLVWMSS
jgi:hypothetical protein